MSPMCAMVLPFNVLYRERIQHGIGNRAVFATIVQNEHTVDVILCVIEICEMEFDFVYNKIVRTTYHA